MFLDLDSLTMWGQRHRWIQRQGGSCLPQSTSGASRNGHVAPWKDAGAPSSLRSPFPHQSWIWIKVWEGGGLGEPGQTRGKHVWKRKSAKIGRVDKIWKLGWGHSRIASLLNPTLPQPVVGSCHVTSPRARCQKIPLLIFNIEHFTKIHSVLPASKAQ